MVAIQEGGEAGRGRGGRKKMREDWRPESVRRDMEQNGWLDTPTATGTEEIKSDTSLAGFNKCSGIWLCERAADSSSSSLIIMHSQDVRYESAGRIFSSARIACHQNRTVTNVKREDSSYVTWGKSLRQVFRDIFHQVLSLFVVRSHSFTTHATNPQEIIRVTSCCRCIQIEREFQIYCFISEKNKNISSSFSLWVGGPVSRFEWQLRHYFPSKAATGHIIIIYNKWKKTSVLDK